MIVDRALVERVRTELLLSDESLDRAHTQAVVERLVRHHAPSLASADVAPTCDAIVAELVGLGPLEPFLADPAVSEIMLNGPERAYAERNGRIEPIDLGLDEAAIRRLLERVIAPLGLRIDRASPIVDARLPDGARVHAIIPPLALDGTVLAVRRFRSRRVELTEFGLDRRSGAFCRWAIDAGWNILVAGGTSTGKTTLLNALGGCIDRAERVVTIEETAELALGLEHVVRLEARPPNADGAGGVSMRELLRAALRLRPDRIVIGEVRGPEAGDLLAALNTGHDGSFATLHANSAAEALDRFATLVMSAALGPTPDCARHIATAVDVVIALQRDRSGVRRVSEIAEVTGPNRVRSLYRSSPVGLRPVAAPERPTRRAGGGPFDPAWFAT